MADNTAELFANLTVGAADEPLPKRVVAGRESIPNPFMDAVQQSYAEAIDPNVGPDKAVRQINVPVDGKAMTWRDTHRKDKNGKKIDTGKWQQHPNITTATYLLRQAAIKQDCGVRIVVDYKDGENGEHLLDVKKGVVRVRFVGQKKKEAKKDKNASTQAAA